MTYDNWKGDTPPRNDDPGSQYEDWITAVEESICEAGAWPDSPDGLDYDYLYDKWKDGYSPEKAAAIFVKERT